MTTVARLLKEESRSVNLRYHTIQVRQIRFACPLLASGSARSGKSEDSR
jgi:hypothetical protein